MGKLEEKSIRIIEFMGKKADWRIWSRKFLARANRKGYKDVIVGKEYIPTLSEYNEAVALESQTEDSESTIAAYKNNELAYEDLLLSISGDSKTGKIAFNLVDNCTTHDSPDGNSKLAWHCLVHK